MIQLFDDFGRRVIVGIHRLLATVFLPTPSGDLRLLIPNHKNGIKHDNQIDNLEWVTYSENTIHAYRTGLRSDNREVVVMNETTRVIRTFYSLGDCGRFFGVEAGAIHWQLNDKREFSPYKGYFLKYGDDSRPWPDVGTTFQKKATDGTKVLVVDIATGVKESFSSMAKAAQRVGCNHLTIANQLKRTPSRPFRGFLIQHDTEGLPGPVG